MKVKANSVVQFHYEIIDANGNKVESSRERDPVLALQGRGNVVHGVDEALLGREVGERFEVTVPPEKAYGIRRADMTQRVSKKYFAQAKRLRKGMQTVLHTEQGVRPVTVLKVGASVVDVDLNHPMAGETIRFDIEILNIREAETSELAHGHAHGPGGAEH